MKAVHRTYLDREGRKRKTKSWFYRFRWHWTGAEGVRHYTTVCRSGGSRNRRETEAFGERHLAALRDGRIGPDQEYTEAKPPTPGPDSIPTLRQYAPKVWESIQPEIKPRTHDFYVETTERILRFQRLADCPLDAIKGSVIKEYVAWRLKARRGNSPAAINAELRALRRILHYAVDQDELLAGCPRIRTLKAKGRDRVITAEEEAKYLSVCTGDLRDAFVLLLDCGLRPDSELFPLLWSNVGPETIQIADSKTEAGIRLVPVGRRARVVLDMRWSARQRSPYVFPGRAASGHLETLKKRHYLTCRMAGVEVFAPYSLRHTFATRCLQAGVDVSVLARWMGHSSDYITRKYYIHLSKHDDARELRKLEAARFISQVSPQSVTSGSVQ